MSSIPVSLPAPVAGRRRWLALVVVCLGQLMNALDSTVVNVALPSIQRELDFTQASLTWVVNGYLITFAGFLLPAGRLGDLVGRKRVFLSGVVLFTVASVACALARDQSVLIGARLLQGLGSAVSSSVIVAIIVSSFTEPAARARAMSIYMFVAVSGGSIGLLVGGALTQLVSWHWIFFINLPIGAIAFLLGAILIEENPGIGLGRGVDALGSVLVTAAMMVGVYAIVGAADSGWVSVRTLGLDALALALLAGFVVRQARTANPIMPLHVLRLRTLAGATVARALVAIAMYTTWFLGTLYLEEVLGYGPTRVGVAFLPMTLITGALSLGLMARLVTRAGPVPTAVLGLLAIIAGVAVLSRITDHTSYFPMLLVGFVLLGTGVSAAFMPLTTIAMADVPRRDAGLASGIVNAAMQVGGAIGVAAMGTISAEHTRALRAAGESLLGAMTGGYTLGFEVAAGCAALALATTVVVLRSARA